MPIHDWSSIPSGLFHDFHQHWTVEIARALNGGLLPKGLSALIEQSACSKGVDEPMVRRSTQEMYAEKANRIVVKRRLSRLVAVIEILSPGNKDSRAAMRDFVDKTVDFMRRGIHLLLIDLFPPSPRDPFGIHKLIWDEIHEEDFQFPTGKDRILASYEMGGERIAYVEPIAVGDRLPPMPLFLIQDMNVRVPLESTYVSTWEASPEEMRIAVETGIMPEPDADED